MTVEIRVRTQVSEATLESIKGKIIGDDAYSVLLTQDTKVFKPNGDLLCVYRKGITPQKILDDSYPTLHYLKKFVTNNRGMASGSLRAARRFDAEGKPVGRQDAKPVASAIIGAFDPAGPRTYCRQTAFTAQELDKYQELYPLFQFIGQRLAFDVPDRFANQAAEVAKTKSEWIVPQTPFTTVTVNNTYPTGVHTDKGDLDAGFSTLAVLRKGAYKGGVFTFPRYGVGVDMQHGDLLLLDAHEWHGNTRLLCPHDFPVSHVDYCGNEGCLPERISIVCYYRTGMVACGTAEEEAKKQVDAAERSIMRGAPIEDSDEALLRETVAKQ